MSFSWRQHWGIPYQGLINQGSTCYLNSVLQVLFMTKGFREALNSCDTESLDIHLKELFDDLKRRTGYTYNITNKLGITRGFVQGDAAECLENILSHVSSPGASQLFKGCLTQKDKCSKCETETNTDDLFWSLPLELVDDHSDYSVVDGITRYFSESDVSGPNQLFCDTCGDKTDSTIKSEMKHHPEVLTLLLKRFQFDFEHMDYVKIKRRVMIPYILEIPNTGPESQLYELYALVEHFGDLRNGHYTATIKSQDDNKWYGFNDTRVTLLSYQPFQLDLIQTSPNAYLLFYRKVSVADTLTENTTEVSRSAASKLDAKDKKEQDKHGVEYRGKGDEGEVAAVNHHSTDRQETEEKSKAGARVNRDEGVIVEKPLNREKMIDQRKTEPQKLLKIADLCSSPTERARAESQSKQESSTIRPKERLKVSNTTFGQHEQVREENGDVKNKRINTDDEHSQRKKMDVTNSDCDNSDAVQHSGRFDDAPNSTVGFRDQTPRIRSNCFIVKETRDVTYLILKKDVQQSVDDGDYQGNKLNVKQESKTDFNNQISHHRPCSSELNTKTRENNKGAKSLQTRGKPESCCADNEAEGTTGQLKETASEVCAKKNYTASVFHKVKAYPTTHDSFQSGVNTGMSQGEEVGVTAERGQKAGDVESLLDSFQSLSLTDPQKPQGHSNESIRGKTESSTERQSLNELKAENTAQVSPSTQIRDETEESHQSDRRGGVCSFLSWSYR